MIRRLRHFRYSLTTISRTISAIPQNTKIICSREPADCDFQKWKKHGSEDVQNFLNATERGIDVQLFVRKNKDDKISKEFYYLGCVIATGNAKQFVMPNTDKTAVEIEWELETPVREDIYQYIVNE